MSINKLIRNGWESFQRVFLFFYISYQMQGLQSCKPRPPAFYVLFKQTTDKFIYL